MSDRVGGNRVRSLLSRCGKRGWRVAAAGAAVLALLAAGCADDPRPERELTPEDLARHGIRAERLRSEHYQITVVGGRGEPPAELSALAEEIAAWMEEGLAAYVRLVGFQPEPAPPMRLYAHRIRSVYDYEANRYGFPPKVTTGFCTVAGEVHLFYKPSGSLDPAATLLHEGFHQYCQRTLFVETPMEVFQAFPGYERQALPTVPLWLAEGMAMVFETGRLARDPDRPVGAYFDYDGYNRPRLDQLQEMLRRDRCPPLDRLLRLQMGDTLTTEIYAAMWGLCYDLLRGGRDDRVVGDLLRAAGNCWGLDPARIVRQCLRDSRSPKEFDRAWNRVLTEAAARHFAERVEASGADLARWEDGWHRRLRQVR